MPVRRQEQLLQVDITHGLLAAFSLAYADQNEEDHAAMARAVRSGTVKAAFEEDR